MPPDHFREQQTGKLNGGKDIHRKQLLPHRGRNIGQKPRHRNPGIVHEHIDMPKLPEELIGHALDLGLF